ncbi:MAG: bactofilin family protein [Patescibacteria group bacterium]
MFHDKEQKIKPEDAQTVIGAGVKVEGTFVAFGDVIVKGQVVGTLETKNDLHLEKGAFIDGDVSANNAYLAGEIKGNVKVNEQAVFDKTARLTGDLECKVLSVEAGAVFNGRCQMGQEVELKTEELKTEE